MFLVPVCFYCPYPRYYYSLVSSGGEFQMFPLAPRRSLRLACIGISSSMRSLLHWLIAGIGRHWGQRGAAKILWDSSTEQTREKTQKLGVQ